MADLSFKTNKGESNKVNNIYHAVNPKHETLYRTTDLVSPTN